MITFHDIKAIHLICMAFYLITTTLYFTNRKRFYSLLHGFAAIIVLLSGIYIAKRLGLSLSNPPKWLAIKAAIWLFLVIFPPIIKSRLSALSGLFLWFAILLGMAAIALSVYKPLFL